jgi:DNA-directed RNA polymerase subunit M/transcription elongation factor TFIIS
MEKVRFSCPRCNTVMQAAADRVGGEVGCPQCQHRFVLVENESPNHATRDFGTSAADAPTMPPSGTRGSNELNFAQPKPGSSSSTPMGSSPYPVGSPPAHHHRFVCPYCQTTHPPIWKSEVSPIGWIVFAVLLVTTCFGCFIGLFIRDRYRVCSQCRVRLD